MRQLKITKSITLRQEEALDKYLSEISRKPLLTADEEVELARVVHSGGQKGLLAKQRLIESNLRFVVSVAKQYQNQGVPLIDLINEGNMGLITAVDKYDETRGFKFISYAIWWIRQSIIAAIGEYSSLIRKPQSHIGISNKIRTATNEFYHQHQRRPSVEELSELISIETGKIEATLQGENHFASIDAPLADGSDTILADLLSSSPNEASDRKLDHESMCCELMRVLRAVLNERERKIVTQSFGIGCQERALDDIGSDMGLTRERVRQIRERSIEKMRKSIESRLLMKHLG